jgi:hypothetical protein
MSRVFTIPTVLRALPADMLRRFFEALGHDQLGVAWERLRKRDPKPLLAAIQRLAPERVDEIESALHAVFDLACDTGIAAIRESEACFEEPSALAALPEGATPYHQAMAAWLANPEVISRAARIHQVESLTWWRKRRDLGPLAPDFSDESLRRFEGELSALLLAEEGRGRVCTAEAMARKGTDYVFAHADDYAQSVTTHDAERRLVPRTVRHTFPIVFAVNRAGGTLETFAKLPARTKPKVEALFAGRVLGVPELPSWPRRPTYRLDHLKPLGFALDTDPADRVRADITQMRFRYNGPKRQLVLKGDPEWPGDTRKFLEEALNPERVPLTSLELTMVTITFEFADEAEPKSLALDVAVPTSSGLRNLPPNRMELVQKCLRRWGIDADEPDGGGLAEAG